MLARYRRLSRALPLSTAFVTCLVKGSASDLVAQCPVEGKTFPSEVDWARNARFSLFSAVYLGCGQHFIYNRLYTSLFGASQSWGTVVRKVAVDNLVHVP